MNKKENKNNREESNKYLKRWSILKEALCPTVIALIGIYIAIQANRISEQQNIMTQITLPLVYTYNISALDVSEAKVSMGDHVLMLSTEIEVELISGSLQRFGIAYPHRPFLNDGFVNYQPHQLFAVHPLPVYRIGELISHGHTIFTRPYSMGLTTNQEFAYFFVWAISGGGEVSVKMQVIGRDADNNFKKLFPAIDQVQMLGGGDNWINLNHHSLRDNITYRPHIVHDARFMFRMFRDFYEALIDIQN